MSSYIVGVGITKFEQAAKSTRDYPDMGREAGEVIFVSWWSFDTVQNGKWHHRIIVSSYRLAQYACWSDVYIIILYAFLVIFCFDNDN